MCFSLHGDSTRGTGNVQTNTSKKVYSKYVQQLVDDIYVNEAEQRNAKDIYFRKEICVGIYSHGIWTDRRGN